MDPLTRARRLAHPNGARKAVAAFMSLVLALGMSPLGHMPASAWADEGDEGDDAEPIYVEGPDEDDDAEALYAVEIADGIQNGSISLIEDEDGAGFAEGAEVVLVIEPDEGYLLDESSLEAVDADGAPVPFSNSEEEGIRTFTMPGSDVRVSAKFEPVLYAIAIEEGENGAVTADKDAAHAGEPVTLAFESEEGYALSGLWANDEELEAAIGEESGACTFTMPAEDVEVAAGFDLKLYGIDVADIENGTVIARPEDGDEEGDEDGDEEAGAYLGDTVYLTIQPDLGYKLAGVTCSYTDREGEAFTKPIEPDEEADDDYRYAFSMPAADVVVHATFVQKAHEIADADGIVNGSISHDSRGDSGEWVDLCVTPDPGFKVVSVTYAVGGAQPVEVESWDSWDEDGYHYLFPMPDEQVVVNAVFEEKAYAVDVVEQEGGTLECEDTRADGGTWFLLYATPDPGNQVVEVAYSTDLEDWTYIPYDADSYLNDSETGTWTYGFEMPDSDVLVRAAFATLHTVTWEYGSDCADGTVEVSSSRAYEGMPVTFTATPDDWRRVGAVSCSYRDDADEEVDVPLTSLGAGAYTFTMPARDVVVRVEFAPYSGVVDVPSAKSGLVYRPGAVQTGVEARPGFTVEGGTASDAGSYGAVAKLEEGYIWSDMTTADKAIAWTIAKKTVAFPTARPLVFSGAAQVGVAGGEGYAVRGGSATNAGSYAAIVTACANYQFPGGKVVATVPWSIARASIANAEVTIASSSLAYTGKALTPAVRGVKLGSLAPSSYTVAYSNNVNVGTAAVTVTGSGNYAGTAKAAFAITPAKNSVKAAKTRVKKTLRAKSLKKRAATIALPKVTTKFGTAKWKVVTKDKKKVLSLSGNKVKVKRKAKKGTYTIKLKASTAKTANYSSAATRPVTVKVTVKK